MAEPANPHPGCPLCGGSRSTIAHVGELVLREERIRQETHVCADCSMTFEVAHPDQDWASLYGDVWQRGAHAARKHVDLYRTDVERIGPGRGRRAFDIGCGCGLLLDELARAGWKTAGCDPEVAAVELAVAKGHDARPELFAPRPEFAADLVILGDVLEHQADPRSMLRDVRAIVEPGARFYVRVPNLAEVNFETFGDVFGLQHRVWFTAATLREMLAVEGFEVVRSGTHARGLYALAERSEPRPWRLPEAEPERSLALVRGYSRDSRRRRERIGARLEAYRGREVALYGGGEHAEELLHFSALGSIASRVVDGNAALWGKSCGALVVEAPSSLRSNPPESVIIASKAYQDEIARELFDLAERGVEIVKLYAESG